MATLEDRLLGEKLEYYCSSSEDEEEDQERVGKSQDLKGHAEDPSQSAFEDFRKWAGTSANTGPKGVIQDWRRFKQVEKMEDAEKRKQAWQDLKKSSLQTKAETDEDKELDALCSGFDADIRNDPFLKEFMQKRMVEMMEQVQIRPRFGSVRRLGSGQQLLDELDNENKDVTVVVHLFENGVEACDTMKGCLVGLAQERPDVKFCQIKATSAGLSRHFASTGVPALLVYKAGQLMGNFIRLTDEFGEDFCASDIEGFLVSHGLLQDTSLSIPSLERQPDSDEDGPLS